MDWTDTATLLQGLAVAACAILFFMGIEYGTRWG